ncbi:hypothetical protein KC19_11G151700 [Ceratodon purpureus]|uniref:Uncharacterized protein n=1 Tax=Ceratodon purpureus TaxID=3225 RepID=A0A8T0GFC6_CERPU|nr:hypothetical protein KC19_11G151700 [Ceratodon purpureus]
MAGDEAGRGLRVSPGGRPIDYRGSEGWASRIIGKSVVAGGVGAGAGVLIGAVKGQPALRFGVAVGTNFLVAASCFCGAQEISRELRASEPEHWVDSVIGGLASGALLGHFQGGRARALPMGILFAGVGTGLQLGAAQYREYRLRHFLSTLPSESLIVEPQVEVSAVEEKTNEDNSWRLPDWFPIQMLSAEEAAKRAQEEEKKRQQRLKSLQIGDLPLEQRSS